MSALSPDFVGRRSAPSLDDVVATRHFERPTLVMDTRIVVRNYHALAASLDGARIHYAVKANPAREIVAALVEEGSGFDAASRGEIELCLGLGARPDTISFGNTIKRESDIAFAHRAGITLFAADAEEELEKIARAAPGARVYIRVIVEPNGADWPLTRKFGCAPGRVGKLLKYAASLGLSPIGLAFHVGSQTRFASMWSDILADMARLWHRLRADGYALELLNIGGGFPAFYGEDIEPPEPYAASVMAQVRDLFGKVPQILAEPGRGLVADAGMIAAEVLLVSRKADTDLHRWVYLDIGRFSGLAETEGEAIRYQFRTWRDGDETGPCILAGPSCDSVDVLYEKRPVQLPLSLRSGDRMVIRNCGAYTSTYASVGFNGFPPLDVMVI